MKKSSFTWKTVKSIINELKMIAIKRDMKANEVLEESLYIAGWYKKIKEDIESNNGTFTMEDFLLIEEKAQAEIKRKYENEKLN